MTEPYSEEALDLQERAQLRQMRGPLYAVWILSAISFAYVHVAQGSNPCALLLTAVFCTLWTVAIRRVTRKYAEAFAERRAELRAFRAGRAEPPAQPGRPQPFTEEEIDWAVAKQRRAAVFTTVASWVLAGWVAWADSSLFTIGFALVLAVACTAALIRWLRRLPEAREQAREQLRAFVAAA